MVEYSILVPIYNESPSLEELVARVNKVFNKMGEPNFEILFVNDGSTDDSLDVLATLKKSHGHLKVISLKRNFGKAMALMSGFSHAKGNFVITMDGDLQDQPEEIPKLIHKVSQGYDLVSGWKSKRKDSSIRVWGSRLFNHTVSKISGLKIHDFNCGFKIYRQSLVKQLVVYGQYHRFVPLLAHSQGAKVSEVSVKHAYRKHGKSKYPAFRYQGLLDLLSILFIYKYRYSPMHFFGKLGATTFLLGAAAISWLVFSHLLYMIDLWPDGAVYNRPLLSLATTLCVLGLEIFLAGIVCEFILDLHVKQNIQKIVSGAEEPTADQNNRTSSKQSSSVGPPLSQDEAPSPV